MSKRGVIRISGKSINSSQLLVSFETLPGTDPKALGHFISVWEGENVLSQAEVIFTQMISTSSSRDEIILSMPYRGEKDCIIGYGVDGYEEMETICATLKFSGSVKTGVMLPSHLSDVFVNQDAIGTDSLIAQLSIPLYYQEKSSFKWIALFHGEFNTQMFLGTNLLASSKCFVPQNCAAILMNDIPEGLVRYETYTLMHGIGLNAIGDPDFSKTVSYHTFIVWKSNIYLGLKDLGLNSLQSRLI